MKPEARILHISSGAAHGALQGLGVYSVSKAALFMAYQVLKAELAPKGIFVGSVRPGIVATSMQDTIRRADKDKFPDTSAKFHQFHEKMPAEHKVGGAPPTAGLDSADNVAVFLDWLLTGTNNEVWLQQAALQGWCLLLPCDVMNRVLYPMCCMGCVLRMSLTIVVRLYVALRTWSSAGVFCGRVGHP